MPLYTTPFWLPVSIFYFSFRPTHDSCPSVRLVRSRELCHFMLMLTIPLESGITSSKLERERRCTTLPCHATTVTIAVQVLTSGQPTNKQVMHWMDGRRVAASYQRDGGCSKPIHQCRLLGVVLLVIGEELTVPPDLKLIYRANVPVCRNHHPIHWTLWAALHCYKSTTLNWFWCGGCWWRHSNTDTGMQHWLDLNFISIERMRRMKRIRTLYIQCRKADYMDVVLLCKQPQQQPNASRPGHGNVNC